jgi:hypothetical protein
MSPAENVILEAVAASMEIPARVRQRADIVLRAAAGVPNHRIAQDLSISVRRHRTHRSFAGFDDDDGGLRQTPGPCFLLT